MGLDRPSLVCDRVRAQISVGLDGELSQLERAMLASHFERCPECKAYEASMTVLTQALREAPFELLSRPVVIRPRRRFVTTSVQVGAAAAVAVTALLGAGGLLRGKSLEIQPAFGPPVNTQVKLPSQQQLEREQAELELAHGGWPVLSQGQVL